MAAPVERAGRLLGPALLAPVLLGALVLWARSAWGISTELAVGLMVAAMALGCGGLVGWSSREFLALQHSRSRSEEALVRSEERFARAFRISPAAVSISHLADGRYLDVNPGFLRLIGHEAGEVVGRTAFEVGFWADPADRDRMLETLRSEGAVREMEVRMRRKSGEIRTILLSAERVDFGGDPCLLALSYDITRLKRTEQALRESEANLEQAQQVAQLGSWIVTAPGAPDASVEWSRETCRIFGVAHGRPPSTPEAFLACVHPEDRERVRAVGTAALARDSGCSLEHRILRPDGALRWVQQRAEIVRDAAGALVRIVGTAQDVTRERLLEDQLRQSQKMEAVGRLAGGIAHDFNNLLSVIIGYAHVLSEKLQDPVLQRKVQEIQKAAGRAARLTRQLLAFSRKQMMSAEVLDLREVVAGLTEMLRRLIGEDVELTTVLPSSVGKVMADPGQIEQILMNLALNARDAMPHGGGLVMQVEDAFLGTSYAKQHVVVPPGRYVLLAVSDTGAGMDAETRSHIFEPFFTTKAEGKGTGLGLATVYGIVKQSGGFIWVYSEPGQGTTFKIYLPCVDAPEPVRRKPAPARPSPSGSETILLAEDEPSLRALAREVLEGEGYRVLDAGSGEQALEIVAAHEGAIHLLLTDVVMPGLSGRALAERLRTSRPALKVLYMSGYTDDMVVRRGVLVERAPLIQKPFTPDSLATAVRDVLDSPLPEDPPLDPLDTREGRH